MIKLSININKFATLRNARGGDIPNLLQIVQDCESYGADGITIHPRPDERHIRYDDAIALKPVVQTEYNIEGYPNERYLSIIKAVKPAQATLVPDPPDAITSSTGWDTIKNQKELIDIIQKLKPYCGRISIFVNPEPKMIEAVQTLGAERIELYTGTYAKMFEHNKKEAILPYIESMKLATSLGLQVNAGHDLNKENLPFFAKQMPQLAEVSIGHSIVCDALYLGLENTINIYKRCLS